jgi:pyruvate dehydrogenase E2 component (dihydrolipoamide acetyltransferase)
MKHKQSPQQSNRIFLLDHHRIFAARSYTRSAVISATTKKEYPPHTVMPMPALSPTMESGSLADWYIREGDSFAAGDALVKVETDKASVDFEAQDDGVLAKILVPSHRDISIGTPICVVVEERGDVAAFADFAVEAAPPAAATSPVLGEESPSAGTTAAPATSATATITTSEETSLLMPSARHLAESKGVDATVLTGTGKGGRVTKGDVLAALEAGTLPPLLVARASQATTASKEAAAAVPSVGQAPSVPPSTPAPVTVQNMIAPIIETANGKFEDLPNNKMRKIIASRLTESKRDVPHFYTSQEVELDAVLALRKQLASQHDVKVSVNDFIISCSALALRDVPEVNGTCTATGTVKLQDSIDVSVAVATPTGLITPIVFSADKLGLSQVSETVRDLAVRARDGKLAPHEYQGGTFSVSNLGMFGITEFSAVINPPQAAILAVGGGSRRVVPGKVAGDGSSKAKPSIKTLMTARLSADRRVVDEATAALFLSAFRHYLSQPELLLL